MKRNWSVTVVFLVLLSSYPLKSTSVAGDPDSISLKGESSYSLQLDPITGEQTKSFSYSLTTENPGQNSTLSTVRLTFHDVELDSLKIASTNVRTLKSASLGKIAELTLSVTIPSGKSTIEISGKPQMLPFSANQSLLVNGLAPNITSVGSYRFVSIKKGDLLDWKVKVSNTYWSVRNGSARPLIPLLLMVTLDPKYFEIRELIPNPNSTKSGGENYWILLVEYSAEIELRIKVAKLSEWGIATLSPFMISYSSDLIGGFTASMKGRAASLNATADFLESVWKSANSSATMVVELANYLKEFGAAINATGKTTYEIGQSLLSASKQINDSASAIDRLSSSLRSLMEAASAERINATIGQARSDITSIRADFQQIVESQDRQRELLLQLNATLKILLSATTDPSQRAEILVSIDILNDLYREVSGQYQPIQEIMTSLNEMDKALAQLNATQIEGIMQSYSASIAGIEQGISTMSAGLKQAGEGLKLMGSINRNQSRLLLNLSSTLLENVNSTTSFMNEMKKRSEDLKSAARNLYDDAQNIEVERDKIPYLSPEIVKDEIEPLRLIALNRTDLNSLLLKAGKDSLYVKYLAFNSTAAFELWNMTSQDSSKVDVLASSGAWTTDGRIYLPVFSTVKTNQTTFQWLGKYPTTLIVNRGFEIIMYYRAKLGNQTEACTVTLLQPDLATKISPVIVGPGELPQPPQDQASLATALITFVILAAMSYGAWNIWKGRKGRLERSKKVQKIEMEAENRDQDHL